MPSYKKTILIWSLFSLLAIATCAIMLTIFNNNLASKLRPSQSSQQLELISARLAKLETQSQEAFSALGALKISTANLSKISQNSKDPSTTDALEEYLLSVNESLYKIEDIIDASGLMAIATNDLIDATVLADLYDDQVNVMKNEAFKKNIMQLSKKQQENDLSRFGEDFKKEMKAASIIWNNNDKAKILANNQAYQDFIARYPDSYAAGVLIAERTFRSIKSFEHDDENSSLALIEDNYNMLNSNPKYLDAVHGQWNMRPASYIQKHLVDTYIENGDYAKAETILSDMEARPDERIWNGAKGMTSFSEITKELRNKIK